MPPVMSHASVSPTVITIVPGVQPLNQTAPPDASGAPAFTPPTFTSWLVAAKLREEEKTKVRKIATDTTAAILANRALCLRTGSTACGGNRATVFNVVPEPSVDRPANGSVRIRI